MVKMITNYKEERVWVVISNKEDYLDEEPPSKVL